MVSLNQMAYGSVVSRQGISRLCTSNQRNKWWCRSLIGLNIRYLDCVKSSLISTPSYHFFPFHADPCKYMTYSVQNDEIIRSYPEEEKILITEQFFYPHL